MTPHTYTHYYKKNSSKKNRLIYSGQTVYIDFHTTQTYIIYRFLKVDAHSSLPHPFGPPGQITWPSDNSCGSLAPKFGECAFLFFPMRWSNRTKMTTQKWFFFFLETTAGKKKKKTSIPQALRAANRSLLQWTVSLSQRMSHSTQRLFFFYI